MAAIANLTIDQGATFSSDVTVKDANGNPFNLTGYTAAAKLAKGFASTRTRTLTTRQRLWCTKSHSEKCGWERGVKASTKWVTWHGATDANLDVTHHV